MKKNILKTSFNLLTLASAVLMSGQSLATDFITLSVTSYGNVPAGAAQGLVDTAINNLETSINSSFPSVDLVPFTTGSAKSSALVTSGVGVDYASDFDFGYLAFNVALASDATASQIQDIAAGTVGNSNYPGVGAAIAMTVGLNFKHLPAIPLVSDIFSPDRTRGYLSFYSSGKSFTGDASSPSLEFSNTIFSAQGQYKIIPGHSVGLGTLKWGGVDIGGGIRYAKTSINVSKSLAGLSGTAGDMGGTLGTPTVSFTGDAIVGVNVKTFSLPIEASTSVRLLHVLGLFFGTGADINLGSGTSALSIDSPVGITSSGATPITGVTAQATAGLSASGKPAFLNVKYFAGIQAEILAFVVSV